MLVNNDEFCAKKRCIMQVNNRDKICFAKAIVKALYRAGGPLKHAKSKSIENENKILDVLAKEWHGKAKVPLGRVTSLDFPKFQGALCKHRIRLLIYSMRYTNALIYDGLSGCKNAESWQQIHLYHREDHFDVITSMQAFVNSSYFCDKCLLGYDHRKGHAREGFCMQCRTFECDGKSIELDKNKSLWTKCADYLRSFRTALCFEKHKIETYKKYTFVLSVVAMSTSIDYPKTKRIYCTDYYCVTCSSWVTETHECFMQKESLLNGDSDEEKIIPKIYIYIMILNVNKALVHTNQIY